MLREAALGQQRLSQAQKLALAVKKHNIKVRGR